MHVQPPRIEHVPAVVGLLEHDANCLCLYGFAVAAAVVVADSMDDDERLMFVADVWWAV